MPRWRIVDGPTPVEYETSDDVTVFFAMLEDVNDPANRRRIRVKIDRSTRQYAPSQLPDDVRHAVETHGRAAIEAFLDEPEPPPVVVVTSDAIFRET